MCLTKVRCEFQSLAICQGSYDMDILGDATFQKWTVQDFPTEYETTLNLQSPFYIRYIFGAWNIDEMEVDGQTIIAKNGLSWKSQTLIGSKPVFHTLPSPVLGINIALKLSKSTDQYISRLSIGGCKEGKTIHYFSTTLPGPTL